MKCNDYVEVIGNLGCYPNHTSFLKHYNLPIINFVVGEYIPIHSIYRIIFIGNNPLVGFSVPLYVLESQNNQIYIMDNNHKEIILHTTTTQDDNKEDDKWWLEYFYNVKPV